MNTHELTKDFLHQAVKTIDVELGAGYAKSHPELVGSYLQAELGLLSTLYLIKSASPAVPSQRPPQPAAKPSARQERAMPKSRSIRPR